MSKRKWMIVAIVFGLLISSTVSFADIDSKLNGHWAENIVDKEFINTHFSYLNNNDGALFNPNTDIAEGDFLISLHSVLTGHEKDSLALQTVNLESIVEYFKDKGVVETEKNTFNASLTRKEAVRLIVKALETTRNIELSEADNDIFSDLTELNEENILCILKANSLKIVNGYKDNTFRPNDNVSQIQAILFLQRLKGELEMKTTGIPFKVVDTKRVNNGSEESVNVQEKDDKILVTVTKQFPTSGYSMNVDRIEKSSESTFKIYLKVERPDPKAIVLQVITYRSITIEIDKGALGEGSYKFEIVGATIGDIKLKSLK